MIEFVANMTAATSYEEMQKVKEEADASHPVDEIR